MDEFGSQQVKKKINGYKEKSFYFVSVSFVVIVIFAGLTSMTKAQQVTSEAFFLNGTSYALISDTLSLSPGRRIGLSFRTCSPGELLKQTGDETFDQLKLQVDGLGRLLLSVSSTNGSLRIPAGSELLDGRWHTALIDATDQKVTLTVTNVGANGSVAREERSDVAGLLAALRLDGGLNPQIRVGAGSMACIREGPGVRFTKRGVAVASVAVKWDGCLLPFTCSGKKRKSP